MKKFYSLALILGFLMISLVSFGQTNISGSVSDENGEPLIGVSILVKGTVTGTITDFEGNFNITVRSAPPITLIFSMVGFSVQEVEISDSNSNDLSITMKEEVMLGQEVVVTGTRVAENIMESPVSIEKMDILDIQNTPADNYYKAIGNLKGVDMTTSSINFQIINTRGFANTGNTRFVQLIDGMDTQAPALNFPIGNLNGPSELDVESVELIPGASSALYGPNAFNGVLTITSKNPFEYQGLSAFAKSGVNHVGKNADQEMAPIFEGSLRYAKAFNNKFAFKVNLSYQRADDWHGTSNVDREIARTPTGFTFNPGSDLLHSMGDEASINLAIFQLSSDYQTLATGKTYNNGYNAWNYAGDLPAHVVSITPWQEKYLIDYGSENIKTNAGLYYRLSEKIEASYLFNGGWGTSIYTGAQRYSLSNFSIMQHRVQLRGDNFYLKAYGTYENSGDSYITEFLAKRILDESSFPTKSVTSWLASYAVNYSTYLADQLGLNPGDGGTMTVQQQMDAHIFARNQMNTLQHPDPGSQDFQSKKNSILSVEGINGTVPNGPKFNDHTSMYHVEGQYNLKNEIDFMSLQVGASYRIFNLNSDGTIFADDIDGGIQISEYGAYAQGAKSLASDRLKLSGSIRYDKNENFDGQFNPRLSTVIKLAENNNIRLSYQTGFRNPTTQGQHINLNIISARLLGGLPQYADQYGLTDLSSAGIPLGYEGYSVQDYSTAVFEAGAQQADMFDPVNIANLEEVTEISPVKPEKIKSIEVGYRGLLSNSRLMVDFSYYYNIYTDFITQIRVRKAEQFTTDPILSADDAEYGYSYHPDPNMEGQINYGTLLNGTSDNNFQIYTNIGTQVTTQGLGLSLDYNFLKGYTLGANYSWNVINDIPEGFLSEFNTPEHKYNIKFGNRKLTDNLGFNVSYRWQARFWWESGFTIPANGWVPSFNTVDAQMSYKLDNLKSILKVGGSNILNKKYYPSLGGPNIGAIYYISLTFDELLN